MKLTKLSRPNRRLFGRTDALALSGVLLIGLFLALFWLLSARQGAYVRVQIDGTPVESFPLDHDLTYEITSESSGYNLLIIQDGQAWLEDASCPDRLCVKTGRISKAGQSIICLPNKVVIEIVGGSERSEVDTVVR